METDRLLSRAFLETHAPDAAAILERLDAGEAAAFLAEVPLDGAALLVRRMEAPARAAAMAD